MHILNFKKDCNGGQWLLLFYYLGKKKWEEEEEFDKVNLQCLSHHSKLMALHISMDQLMQTRALEGLQKKNK